MSTAEIRRYWDALVRDGCFICHAPCEIAHAHGGSIVERLKQPKAKGRKLPAYDFLVLALCERHHRDVYETGLDRDVLAWESIFGTQAEWIDRTNLARTGVDPWAKARALMKPVPERAA